MNDSPRPSLIALIPPPLMFAVPLIIGLLLKTRVPLVHPGVWATRPLEWLGLLCIAAGVAHVLTSVVLFAASRTTIIPHHHASTFVQRGAYRWTRNPMYVGLTLIYVGICSMSGALLPLLFLPLPLLVIDRKVIPMEERHMEERFGAAYVDYKSRVKRWL